MKYIHSLLIISLLIVSCKTRQKQPFGRDLRLENKKWALRELNGKKVILPADAKVITLNFEAGNNIFGGHGGCNTMNGMFTVQDEMIKLQSMETTKMACPQLQTETEFFQVLEKANKYVVKSNREKPVDKLMLMLYENEVLTATFDAVP